MTSQTGLKRNSPKLVAIVMLFGAAGIAIGYALGKLIF